MKRITAAIYDNFVAAWDLHRVLEKAGVNAKVVTKHAVQILPGQEELARAAVEAEKIKRQALEEERGKVVNPDDR